MVSSTTDNLQVGKVGKRSAPPQKRGVTSPNSKVPEKGDATLERGCASLTHLPNLQIFNPCMIHFGAVSIFYLR